MWMPKWEWYGGDLIYLCITYAYCISLYIQLELLFNYTLNRMIELKSINYSQMVVLWKGKTLIFVIKHIDKEFLFI